VAVATFVSLAVRARQRKTDGVDHLCPGFFPRGACIVSWDTYNRAIEKGSINSMLGIASAFRPLYLWWVVLLGVLLVGCSPEPDQELSQASLSQLEQRVHDRWQAKMAHDWGALWEYNTPNYRRVFPKDLYIGKFSYLLNWELTGIEVVNYDAAAAVASVAVRVMSEPVKYTSAASKAVGAMPYTFNERWIYVEGEWWHSANF
jgi:hypothetical protein